MEKRAATSYTANLGLQWRKGLVTLDKTEASKEMALKMLSDFYYPPAGVLNRLKPCGMLSRS